MELHLTRDEGEAGVQFREELSVLREIKQDAKFLIWPQTVNAATEYRR